MAKLKTKEAALADVNPVDHAGFYKFRGRPGHYLVFYQSYPSEFEGGPTKEGWYWYAPLGESSGPFHTSREAFDDAQG